MRLGATLLFLLMSSVTSIPSHAEPLNLRNPNPRQVMVQFEVSPVDRPGSLDASYTEFVPAWFQPTERPGEVRVIIAGSVVEESLFANHNPKPGSFSDFVWIFDVLSGHVISAALSGSVITKVRWGFITAQTEARIQVRLTTLETLGFAPARELFGRFVFPSCGAGDAKCTLIDATCFDPASGYVNAVGETAARSRGLTTRIFSSLGEARFAELDPTRLLRASAPGSRRSSAQIESSIVKSLRNVGSLAPR